MPSIDRSEECAPVPSRPPEEVGQTLAREWQMLGAELALTEACNGDTAALVQQRCALMDRVDAYVGRPATPDHAAFVAAVLELLAAHAHRPLLAVRVFATGGDRTGCPLRWRDPSAARGTTRPETAAFLHVHPCEAAEAGACVLDDDLRSGGSERAGECARYLWEVWADDHCPCLITRRA